MKQRELPEKKWKRGWVGALLTAFIGAFFLVTPFGESLTHLSYDIPFALRSDIRPDGAVIVSMDEESYRLLNQAPAGPWDRSEHTRLVKELTKRHARAVVFDLLFDQASTDHAIDQEFASAMMANREVVLAASAQREVTAGQPPVIKVIRPIEPLASAASWGVVELPVDTDGVIRRHYLDISYTNLAWQTATVIGEAPPKRMAERWMNYYAPQNAIPTVSYYQLFEPHALPPDFFQGKVVFVGLGTIIGYRTSKATDEFPTPYSRWTGFDMPGVEIHATAFLNLIHHDWLNRLPAWVELTVVVGLGVAFGLGLGRLRPVAATAVGLVSVICIVVAASLLVWNERIWFCWTIVPCLQIPVALGWAVLTQPTTHLPAVQPSPPARVSEELPPIPDHVLLRCIGEGSYGQVWLARNIMGVHRAVKVIHRSQFESDSPFDREFIGIRNFEPLSRSHPGFVDILHVGRDDSSGFLFYIMEVADDLALAQRINPDTYTPKTLSKVLGKNGRLPAGDCVSIALCLSDALERLHENGLVHRDIKPSNIIYVGGIPKLADIGLVAEVREAKSYVGTSGFIAPEGPGTPQADVYSLGKVLYEICMGRDRCNFPELPSDLGDGCEHDTMLELNDIILKACAKSPKKRYFSAKRFHDDLKRVAVG